MEMPITTPTFTTYNKPLPPIRAELPLITFQKDDPVAATPEQMSKLLEGSINREEYIPEEARIKETLSKYNGLMWPCTYSKGHPTEKLLTLYAKEGCPVNCGED
eukprot:3163178-Ditylum_brightwellii.AAC.1